MNTSVTPPKGRVKAPRALAQHARLDLDAWVGAQSVELLKALHILTREGQLNQDSRRKLKQVNHLVQLLEGPLRELNDLVIKWCVPRIMSEIEQYNYYLNDISHLPIPLEQPMNLSSAGTKSLPFQLQM